MMRLIAFKLIVILWWFHIDSHLETAKLRPGPNKRERKGQKN
jgi:tRNA (Thr-GGU) A37 N-methylase